MRRIRIKPLEPEPDGSFLLDEGDEIINLVWHYPEFDAPPAPLYIWVVDASVSDG
jgi:hypothetical protein